MKKIKGLFLAAVLLSAILVFTIFTGNSNALEVVLEPAYGELKIGVGMRIHIFASGAEDLISMGVKVSFNPAVLEVVNVEKNDAVDDPENVWRMTIVKEDGAMFSYNTPAVELDNMGGTVTMIGGHLYENRQTGASTQGLSGKVLLGWIDFRAKALGISDLYVDLAKYHPQHPAKRFDNFVNLNTNVDEPTNLGDVGVINVMSDNDNDDDDGLSNEYEVNVTGTDPVLSDTDGDYITDDAEDMDFDGMSNIEEYLAGTHPMEPNIYLFPGLNLVGYPVKVPEGYSSYDLLIDLGTEDEVDMIQKYNPATGAFETTTYEAGVITGDVFDIVSGEGYYVYMKESKLISFAGQIMTPDIGLEPGSNLISLHCMPPDYTSYDLLSYLGSAGEVASIQRFDRETGTFETTVYYYGLASGVQFNVSNGEAYLVHMNVSMNVSSLLTAPVVGITSPSHGETVSSSPIEVSGTLSDGLCSVKVNGILANVSEGTFTAIGVPVNEGTNTITATVVSPNNLTGSHTISIILE